MMKAKQIIGLIISLISVLGINFIPLEMFLYRDFSGESAMLFYSLETITAIIFSLIFVLLLAPVQEENPDYPRRAELARTTAFPINKLREKKEILLNFIIFAGGFSGVSTIFVLCFVFLILKTKIQFSIIADAFIWILAFQTIEIFGAYLITRPLTLAKTEVFLKGVMSRVGVLFTAVFIGIFVAALADRWFVIPFIVLKTLVDVGEIIREFKLVFSGKNIHSSPAQTN